MENKENGVFVNTLLDLLQNDNIVNAIDERIIKMSKEVAYRNIELEKKINKALKYIRENFQQNIISGSEYLITYSCCTDLLNILEGEDK